jgi:hypothetical protein
MRDRKIWDKSSGTFAPSGRPSTRVDRDDCGNSGSPGVDLVCGGLRQRPDIRFLHHAGDHGAAGGCRAGAGLGTVGLDRVTFQDDPYHAGCPAVRKRGYRLGGGSDDGTLARARPGRRASAAPGRGSGGSPGNRLARGEERSALPASGHKARPQLALEDLPGRVAGECGDEGDGDRALVVGQPVPGERDERCLVDGRLRGGYHDLWVPKTYTTRRYSWIMPAARSRRWTRKWSRSAMPSGSGRSGAACFRARCGR